MSEDMRAKLIEVLEAHSEWHADHGPECPDECLADAVTSLFADIWEQGMLAQRNAMFPHSVLPNPYRDVAATAEQEWEPSRIEVMIDQHLLRIVNFLRAPDNTSDRRVDLYANTFGVPVELILRIGYDGGLLTPAERERYVHLREALGA